MFFIADAWRFLHIRYTCLEPVALKGDLANFDSEPCARAFEVSTDLRADQADRAGACEAVKEDGTGGFEPVGVKAG